MTQVAAVASVREHVRVIWTEGCASLKAFACGCVHCRLGAWPRRQDELSWEGGVQAHSVRAPRGFFLISLVVVLIIERGRD